MEMQEFLTQYVVERRGTDSMKWDELGDKFKDADLLAMWVADMDFCTCDAIRDALVERISHGAFGYANVPESYYEAYSNWMEKRYNFPVHKDWVRFSTGCVTAIAWMIHAFTKPQEACLILTPVYYPFHNVVTNNDRKLVTVDLDYADGYFTMNFAAIEQAIVDHQVKMFLQCSPHNPVGRVWSEQELSQILDICARHQVLVVSDEIHQDILPGEKPFIPSAIVADGKYRDRILTLTSASKTFNLASLVHSHIVITNSSLMQIYDRFASGLNRTATNAMGITATEAGYTGGSAWLKNIVAIIRENYNYLKRELNENVPNITVCALEGTYLVLLDLRGLVNPEDTEDFIQRRCRLAVDYGEWFGDHFKGFVRLNLATSPENVQLAVSNIIREAGKLSMS